MEYYSKVLLSIPLAFLAPYSVLALFGHIGAEAALLAALPSTVLLGHALFVENPG